MLLTYSGHLGDWYVPVWVPKFWCPKNTSSFLLSVVFQQICQSSDQ